MLILGIDTASSRSSIALTEGDLLLGEIGTDSYARNSEQLIPVIDELLQNNSLSYKDIGLVAISIGPGSFTGLRVGLSTAKGIAYSLQIPIISVDSLLARAFAVYTNQNIRIGVALDAKRGEVFAGVFEFNTTDYHPIVNSSLFKLNSFVELCNSMQINTIATDLGSYDCMYVLGFRGTLQTINLVYNSLYLCKLANIYYSSVGADDINILSPKYLVDFKPGIPR